MAYYDLIKNTKVVTGEARDLRSVREPVYEIVVQVAARRHEPPLVRGAALTDDDLRARLPAGNKFQQVLQRVLEVLNH